LLQIESVNLVNYEKNDNKPTWKVVCSFYTNMSGTERVKREIFFENCVIINEVRQARI